jgi:subtilisin family serine protease
MSPSTSTCTRRRLAATNARCNRFRPRLEHLEDRLVLSASAADDWLASLPAAVRASHPNLATVGWNGSQVVYEGGEWIASFGALSSSPAEQVAAVQRELNGIQAPASLTVLKQLGSDGLVELGAPAGMGYDTLQGLLRPLPGFHYVEPNMVVTSSSVPNDPLFGQQWALQNTGQTVLGVAGRAGADISATGAWNFTTGSTNVVVGVIDTGINYTHPDVANQIWINQAEIPTLPAAPSNPTGKSRLANLQDFDGDGLITLYDLNYTPDGVSYPNQGPGKIMAADGGQVITAADILRPMDTVTINGQLFDLGTGGWAYQGNTQDGDTAHPNDFIGWNFVTNTNNPMDDNGHGTHVSGIIGAQGNNGVGVAGVNWSIQEMPLKFLDGSGFGSTANAILALNFAVEKHNEGTNIKVTNNSYGGGLFGFSIFDQAQEDAIKATGDAGMLFVAAAGNDFVGHNNDTNPTYPATYKLPNIISVAATDSRDQLASFSNFGRTSVDLGAPGVNILSTIPQGLRGFGSTSGLPDGYAFLSGTSMASPQVAGVAALLWSLHPDASFTDVKNAILVGVDSIPALANVTKTGGRLDALKALLQFASGPAVIASTPSGDLTGSVSSVRLTFSVPIDPASFTTGKVVSFTRTTGSTVTDLLPLLTGVTPVAGSGNTQFDVTFLALTGLGEYSMVVGPDIRDTVGRPMDQNLNGAPGEVPADRYTAQFTLRGPRVIAQTPSLQVLAGVQSARVTFNEPIDPTTFTLDTIVSFVGPNGPLTVNAVRAVAGSRDTSFDILFDRLTVPGAYQIVIGPHARDFNGNELDQDGDFVGGQDTDAYVLNIGIQGLRVTGSDAGIDSTHSPNTFHSLTVTFNEPVPADSFDRTKVSLVGPAGEIGVTNVQPSFILNSFVITFDGATLAGRYTMRIGPDIRDTFGNVMDQDDDLVSGEDDDAFVITFRVVGQQILFGQSQTQGDQVNNVYTSVRVHFSLFPGESIDPTTFTPDKVQFSGPGGAIPINAVVPVAGSGNDSFDIFFAPQSQTGTYTMLIGPDVRDNFGSPMDEDRDFTGEEDPDDGFTHTFTVAGPKVLSTTPARSLEPLSSLRVTFSKPIDPTTFTPDQVTDFQGPNGPISVAGVFLVPGSNGTQYDIDFLPQTATGVYTLVIGPNIRDLSGNPLDQDGDLLGDEGPSDQYTATFGIEGPRVTGTSPANFAGTTGDHIRLTFNEPIDVSTFTTDEVRFTGPDGGAIGVTRVAPVPLMLNTQFDVFFVPQTMLGNYHMVVGPDIRDLHGNPLDQDNDLVGVDPFILDFSVHGLKVLSIRALEDGRAVTALEVTFNEPVDPTTFTADKITSFKDPAGHDLQVQEVDAVAGSNGTVFDVRFAPQSALGNYTMIIGPDIQDLFGHRMDQDGNFTDGEPADAYTATFAPQIHVLIVSSGSANLSGWNDGSFVITQVTPSFLAFQTLSNFDVIWVSSGDSSLTSQRSRIADFVRAGGGLVSDAGVLSVAPNAADLSFALAFGGAVGLTDTGKTHPVTSWLTDADLTNQIFNYQFAFTRTGGMDVLTTIRENPDFSLILAGSFGSGHLLYFANSVLPSAPSNALAARLVREAARWAEVGTPGGGSSAPAPSSGGVSGGASVIAASALSAGVSDADATVLAAYPSKDPQETRAAAALGDALSEFAATPPWFIASSAPSPPENSIPLCRRWTAPQDVGIVDHLFAKVGAEGEAPAFRAPKRVQFLVRQDPLAALFAPDANDTPGVSAKPASWRRYSRSWARRSC